MRTLAVALLLAAVASLVGATPAVASCAPPSSVVDNAARAVAVVQGSVTSVGGGALTMRVSKVFKGQVGATVRVFVGPGRAGVAATSVDYGAQAGTEHVLYLLKGTDGQLETNACGGSHPGAATADELALFGAGSNPDGRSRDGSAANLAFGPELLFWLATGLAILGASFFVLRSRKRVTSR